MDIASLVDGYLTAFEQARVFDAATIRNKLNEYVKEGLLISRKKVKRSYIVVQKNLNCRIRMFWISFQKLHPAV